MPVGPNVTAAPPLGVALVRGRPRFFSEFNNRMFESNDGPRAGTLSRLYREFAQFYAQERCRWAPTNPRRVFNLALESVYPRFEDRLSEEEFVGVMYSTLGFPGSKPSGLFETFDPTRYTGKLPLDDHFTNLFRAHLEWRARDRLREGAGRQQDVDGPEAKRPRERLCDPDRLDRLPCREHRRYDRGERALVDALPEGLGRLSQEEFTVIGMAYWGGCSLRQVAAGLGLDRGTVRRRHDEALSQLRAFYGVAEKSAA